MREPHALLVAGPTASGKSALALALAEELGGTIVNADSMQVYRELRIVTARPTETEEARVPHRLYGVRPAAEAGSAAWWRATALTEMDRAHASGRLPIICGGTGMYFAALVQGLAAIPAIGDAARTEARRLLADQGAAALHAALAHVDQATAARLHPTDGQRIARAWEVWRQTGRGLAAWQSDAATPAPWRFTALLIDPAREPLRAAIAARFDAMLEQGALAEVATLAAGNLDPALPAMRAHGVPELLAHLRGETCLADAARLAVFATGRYTKRQATWFRHHSLADPARTHMIHARFAGLEQVSERTWAEIIAFVRAG